MTAFAFVLTLFLFRVMYEGAGYWSLSRELRADHPLHHLYAAGGGVGVGLGLFGTGLMTAMTLYTLRKWLTRWEWLGSLGSWLQFHIVCGIWGPLFILLHTGFLWPTGLIAVGFWCMVLVALSGVFGRYVYGFFPRLSSGKALAWDDALEELADLRAALVAATSGTRSHAVGHAVQVVQTFEMDAYSVLDLWRLNVETRRRKRRIREHLKEAELPREVHDEALRTLSDQLQLRRGLDASRVAYRLFRYWHLFHRPLAMAMYTIIVFHIGFAIVFGGSLNRFFALFGGT